MASLLNRSIIVKTGKLLQNSIKTGGGGGGPGGQVRSVISKPSGAMLPEPVSSPISLVGFGGTVIVGLGLGATISKHFASFLEENDLFVPADDDDDD